MKQLSEVLLETWAVKKLKEVGLTPDSEATITVREREEWNEGGCETCGPWCDYFVVVVVNGYDSLTIEGTLHDLIQEIMPNADAPEGVE